MRLNDGPHSRASEIPDTGLRDSRRPCRATVPNLQTGKPAGGQTPTITASPSPPAHQALARSQPATRPQANAASSIVAAACPPVRSPLLSPLCLLARLLDLQACLNNEHHRLAPPSGRTRPGSRRTRATPPPPPARDDAPLGHALGAPHALPRPRPPSARPWWQGDGQAAQTARAVQGHPRRRPARTDRAPRRLPAEPPCGRKKGRARLGGYVITLLIRLYERGQREQRRRTAVARGVRRSGRSAGWPLGPLGWAELA